MIFIRKVFIYMPKNFNGSKLYKIVKILLLRHSLNLKNNVILLCSGFLCHCKWTSSLICHNFLLTFPHQQKLVLVTLAHKMFQRLKQTQQNHERHVHLLFPDSIIEQLNEQKMNNSCRTKIQIRSNHDLAKLLVTCQKAQRFQS